MNEIKRTLRNGDRVKLTTKKPTDTVIYGALSQEILDDDRGVYVRVDGESTSRFFVDRAWNVEKVRIPTEQQFAELPLGAAFRIIDPKTGAPRSDLRVKVRPSMYVITLDEDHPNFGSITIHNVAALGGFDLEQVKL